MSNFIVDEALDLFIEDIGDSISCNTVKESVVNKYEDKLPKQLIYYWRKVGWCGYGDGIIWMVNPSDYQDMLGDWLRGTSFEKRKDLSVIARSAFGKLYVWSKGKGDVLTIVPILGVIYFYPEKFERLLSQKDEDKYLSNFWAFQDKKQIDIEDENDNLLFERALEKLGSLKSDEMYGLKHARMLGGSITLDNLDIMKISVYHDIARQMDDPEIIVIDTSD